MSAHVQPSLDADIAGIDVGLTLLDPTSGVCRSGPSGDVFGHTFCDYLSRTSVLGRGRRYSVLAVDAPLLPQGILHYEARACEKTFVWGLFQRRCKPGESHVPGTGQSLRRAGAETAHTFRSDVDIVELACPFPRIQVPLNIVEAFPNAFLGVCLQDGSFTATPGRGGKFDWLYDESVGQGVFHRLQSALAWPSDEFWRQSTSNDDHDERAAIVCAMTAIAVLRGQYVAVGEPLGGYFFLPPWDLWQPWAKRTLDSNRRDLRLRTPVDVWMNGTRFPDHMGLPS